MKNNGIGNILLPLILGLPLIAQARSPFSEAKWIRAPFEYPEIQKKSKDCAPLSTRFFKQTKNKELVVGAVWKVTSLGVHSLGVNGQTPNPKRTLAPGSTTPTKRRLVFDYDILPLLNSGKGEINDFSAIVSAGWWRDGVTGFAGKNSALKGEIEFTYSDGTKEIVPTDETWLAGVNSPVALGGIWDGEIYDATIENIDAQKLSMAIESDEFSGEESYHIGGEVYLREDLALKPINRECPFTLKKGETIILDFGQNSAAVPKFVFASTPETTLEYFPAEMLNDSDKSAKRGSDGPRGSVYRANLRGIRAKGAYTFGAGAADGNFVEYIPRHTFFGYRYIALKANNDVQIKSIKSIPVTSIKEGADTLEIVSSDPALNQFVSNVRWGMRSNYLSIPTDCPQRDERLGWTGDTQIFAKTACYFADVYDFLSKWMQDMRDSRNGDLFIDVAPTGPWGGETSAGWADAGIVIPYTLWKTYGKKEILEENWQAMTLFAEHVLKHRYRMKVGKTSYGDWLSFEPYGTCGNRWSNKTLTADHVTYWNFLGYAWAIIDADMMSEMARGLGKGDEAKKWEAEKQKVLLDFRKEFLEEDGLIKNMFRGMQTPNLFALKTGLVEGDAKERTIKLLRGNFAGNSNRLATGFLGTGILLDTLSQNNMDDLAWHLMLSHGFPSWLYSVDQGATTVWERWNSYTKEKGFGDVKMNSFNHYAYGAAAGWLVEYAAGISPLEPGYKKIRLAPRPNPLLKSLRVSYRSPVGLIVSEWQYDDNGKLNWNYSIPEGIEAEIIPPKE